MKNQILAGDFPKNAQINLVLGSVVLTAPASFKSKAVSIKFNKDSVEKVELQKDQESIDKKSAVSRALIGGALLGGVGAVLGARTAKDKHAYKVAITLKDGKRLLAVLDQKTYEALEKATF